MSLSAQLLWVAVGGSLGASLRFLVSHFLNQKFASALIPIGTTVVNVIGSALMAVCFYWLVERGGLPTFYKPLLMSGFLGAFTTFSTFSMEAILLMQQGAIPSALGYVLVNVCVSILAFCAALYLMRLVV